MAYNVYNTRNSGRYNTAGRFVRGGELALGGPVGGGNRHRPNFNEQNNRQNNFRPNLQQPPPNLQPVPTLPQSAPARSQPPPPPPPPPPPQQQTMAQAAHQQLMQTLDVTMKDATETTKETTEHRPHWMKSKLLGVKKITNKERRRRQNENLRRLLAPKNALMVLNEMMPGEPREVAQFKVEPAAGCFAAAGAPQAFCAELTVDGTEYKGYGDNKVAARNDAAEQAIRDLIIKRMSKAISSESGAADSEDGGASGAGGGGGGTAEEEEAPLPMIQLASFALHKLFAEWECDGHKVPQLKPSPAPAHHISDNISEASGGGGGGGGGTRGASKVRTLPARAAAMHPCMLLTYMRPHLEYRELAVEGDRPQNMLFTMGIDVDGVTYIGKATNKREARKMAARAACQALFKVEFEPPAPQPPSANFVPAQPASDYPANPFVPAGDDKQQHEL